MGLPGREVTEYVSPDGRAVLWMVSGPGRLFSVALAVWSPLRSGRWLVASNATGLESQSWVAATLKDARRSVLAGNGRRSGGHAEVTEVREYSKADILALAGV
jgi:hypothetical protein